MALSVPLSRFTSRVGGGSAFYVRPLAHMNPLSSSQTRGQSCLDWIGLGFMSIAAPAIAGFIRCCCTRIAGDFHLGTLSYSVDNLDLDGFSIILNLCSILVIPTFLVLLPFRRRVLFRWMTWMCCTILWTLLLSRIGFARR